MLEMMDSSYHPTIKTLIGNVFDGKISWPLFKAKDVLLFASCHISDAEHNRITKMYDLRLLCLNLKPCFFPP